MCFLGVHWLVLVIVVQIKLVYRVVISTDCRSSCASFFLLISKATYFKNHLTGWMNFTYIFVLINFLHYIYEKESVKLYFICLYHYQTHLAITFLKLTHFNLSNKKLLTNLYYSVQYLLNTWLLTLGKWSVHLGNWMFNFI